MEQVSELWLLNLDKGRLRGDLVTPYDYFKGSCRRVRVGLFFQEASDIARRNGLKLHQRSFRLDDKKFLH